MILKFSDFVNENQIVNRENKYKSRFSIDELTIKNKSGKEIKREVMVRKDAVAALVYDTVLDKYIFVEQFRPGSGSSILEIVAGTLDKEGENPEDAIKREIEEEIGYKTDSIEYIDECYMSPGGSTELIYVYYCEVSEKISKGGGLEEEDEEIDIVALTKEEVLKTKFRDAKTLIGVSYLKSRKKSLINESFNDELIKVEPNKFLYHKSNPIFRDKISKEGLKVMPKSSAWLSDTRIDGSCIFATNIDDKRYWFDSTYDDDIYKIDSSKINNTWYIDPNFISKDKYVEYKGKRAMLPNVNMDYKHVITFDNIPLNAIELIYEGTGKSLF